MRFLEFNLNNPLHFPAKQISINDETYFRVVGNPFADAERQFQYAAKKNPWQFANYIRVMYTAMRWAKAYFQVKELQELNVFHYKLNDNKSSFSMQIGSMMKSYNLNDEQYHPFFQIEYGYDNPLYVKLKMGFSRAACWNGAIYGYKELDQIKIHINHLDKAFPLSACDFDFQALGLKRKINWLKNMPVPDYVFQTIAHKHKPLVERYTQEIGENAYAVVNIFTDHATFPNGRNKISEDSLKITNNDQSIWTPSANTDAQEKAGRLFERLAAVAQLSLNQTIPDEAFADVDAMEEFYKKYKPTSEDGNQISFLIQDHLQTTLGGF
jgi:hypothetical protein